jgi:hypothetical protein
VGRYSGVNESQVEMSVRRDECVGGANVNAVMGMQGGSEKKRSQSASHVVL